jgi:hypothetical protein
MSRNKNVDYTQYIHPFTDERGVTRYAVAKIKAYFQGDIIEYWQPRTQKEFYIYDEDYKRALDVSEFGGYLTRRQALRRARYLFGGK